MAEIRFTVFGRRIAITGTRGHWSAYELGVDGKRRPAGFVVAHDLLEEELAQYLADLFHEAATPSNGDVHRID